MKKINILITNVSYQASAGSIIKLLRKSEVFDFYIVGCDKIEKGYSSGSMLSDKFFHVPCNEDTSYVKYLTDIIQSEKIDIIITAEEKDLVLLKKNKIKQAIYKYIPDESIFELFKDKHLATERMKEYGFAVPKTIYHYHEFLTSNSDFIIRRKRVSCSSRGITVFNRRDITDNYDFFSDDYITQEFIFGNMYTVDVFCDKDGNPHSIIPRRILSSKDGTTFKCIVEFQKDIIDTCKRVYSIFNIPGISNIQFIVDKIPFFIELNPRAAAAMIASALTSVNYTDLYVNHFLLNEDLPSYESIMSSVKWNSVISRYYQETVLFPED